MNITRRRGTIAFVITLGAILVGLTITQSAWLLLNERRFHLLAFKHEGHKHSLPAPVLIGGQSRQAIPAVNELFNG